MATNGNGSGGAVDFSAFVPLDTIEHEVLAPDGSRTGWVITLCDVSHPKAQAHINDQTRRRLHKEKLQEQAMVNGRKYQADERSVDESRLDNVRWLTSRIVDWTPVRLPFISAEPVRFSDEAATRALMHPKLTFVLTQLVDVLVAERSFMQRSPMASEPSPSASSFSPPESPTEPHTASS
jgi:hypothetical protein